MHDSHIHISMSPLKENMYGDIQEFIDLNGKKILAQTTDITDYQDTIALTETLNKKFKNIVDLAIGIHPNVFEEGCMNNQLEDFDLYKYSQKQINLFEEVLKENINKTNAIGECGLDYYNMYLYGNFTSIQIEELKEIQRRAFKKLCQLAKQYDLPMSIHARAKDGDNSCVKDALTILACEGKGSIRGCFHSYTGSKEMLNSILDLGMYIGFNAIVTYPNGENVRELVNLTPIENILLETDGPFLPTQRVRKDKKIQKRYGRPSLVKDIIEIIAKIKDTTYTNIESITDNNYTKLFEKKVKS
ncbi:MAG: hydrolase, TatD family, TatD DNase family protein [candidate division WS6 bacterium GW2011_GWE2_33_157]|uniref:Hydrolase, TatD family n=2 Tax=Candidatus Dojkabacteria TaxID=74243 RepID=A0A0G0AD20_9BACT|nr:MAG: hydrolase, TatD family, TatD DNase family protein [candidate division WS6 bacterium GW2011_GWE2_33_157]KKP54724.1 MAG: Hydrolase, TatD family [candidate division WS6 bacterium GW2011_GWB1_33_6]KKP54930.1 MAG: hydrolase, TatD family, TatD DNase family protein [candidate division WS6 bacterium GW2011_WS6_33_547]KKP56747.1 MAG: Hydrolase, TatD family [candidate division WS6 bacterium GW2011_GWF2_33_92]KKP82112.1 MAG: Hydrolase, TatD family [candidate division WS6 bacterium GW2011_GWD1_35_5